MVHQVAAIQVGRHRFLSCPYRFLAAKRQAKAGLSSGHSHYRTTFDSFAPDISEKPDPNRTDLFDRRNHGSHRLSASYQHTRHVVVTRTHARTYNARQREKSPDSPATPSCTDKHCCCCIVTKCGVVFFYPACSELFLKRFTFFGKS